MVRDIATADTANSPRGILPARSFSTSARYCDTPARRSIYRVSQPSSMRPYVENQLRPALLLFNQDAGGGDEAHPPVRQPPLPHHAPSISIRCRGASGRFGQQADMCLEPVQVNLLQNPNPSCPCRTARRAPQWSSQCRAAGWQMGRMRRPRGAAPPSNDSNTAS